MLDMEREDGDVCYSDDQSYVQTMHTCNQQVISAMYAISIQICIPSSRTNVHQQTARSVEAIISSRLFGLFLIARASLGIRSFLSDCFLKTDNNGSHK